MGSAKHRAKLASLQAGSVTATEDDGAESMTGSTFSLGEPTSIVRKGVADDSASEADIISVADSTDQASTADDAASTQSTESTNPAPTTTKCLFCNATSPTLEANVIHMEKTHNLFIPERVYLVDLAGLVAHLSERVFELHECLYCGQMRHSTVGVQTHMRDKGHCMIAFESEEEMVEVGEFYDFTSTYSDDEEDDADANDDNDEEWEDADDASDASDATETDPTAPRPPRPATDRAYASAYELHLPSGRTAGHRSLARYFRQNLHNYPSPAERMAQLAIADEAATAAADEADNGRGRQVVSRANGGTGMLGVSDLKKKEVVREEVRERRRAERREGRVQWGKDRVGNSQKHYRVSLFFSLGRSGRVADFVAGSFASVSALVRSGIFSSWETARCCWAVWCVLGVVVELGLAGVGYFAGSLALSSRGRFFFGVGY